MIDSLFTTNRNRFAVLLVVSTCLFFLRLDCALLEPEESRYAEIPREMLAVGEWVVPLYHGQPYYDKPPLLYWLIMLSYSAFGVYDWAARLVPGFCGVFTVLVVYMWGRRTLSDTSAFLGALILSLTFRFVYLGRMLGTDAPLSFSVVAALGCAHIAIMGPTLRWRWWLASGFFCGVGLLAKGPVTFALVGVPILGYLIGNARAARPGLSAVAAFLATALMTAGPWYIALILSDPSFAEYFFWRHHVVRYLTPFDHAKPFWFYGPDLIVGTMPWCLLLVPLVAGLWRQRHRFRERQPPEILLPLLASLWCCLFFSASGSKRVGYILPMFAPLALVLGKQAEEMLKNFRIGSSAAREWIAAMTLIAYLSGSVGAIVLALFGYWPIAAAVCVGLFCLALAVTHYILGRRIDPVVGFRMCVIIIFTESVVGVSWALPAYAERFSLKREVEAAGKETPATMPVVCFPRGWDSVSFYLKRGDVAVFTQADGSRLVDFLQTHHETRVFLRDGDISRKFLDELPCSLGYSERARQGNMRSVLVSHVARGALAKTLDLPALATYNTENSSRD